MIERWAITFGEVVMMLSVTVLFGLLHLPFWLGILGLIIGGAGIAAGFIGGEMPARNYFQVLAVMAGLTLIMSLGAVLAGSHALLGVPLTTGSFVLFVTIVAATFFAGFEPEAIEPGTEEPERELVVQM